MFKSEINNITTCLRRRALVFLVALIFVVNYEFQVRRREPPPPWHIKLPNDSSDQPNTTITITSRQRPALLWDDLDLSSTLNCGRHRCFVPSVSESSVGYIISRIEEGTYTGMVNEAKLAHKMQENYKCKTFHIIDEMPINVTLPTKIASKVNAQVRNQLRQYQFPDSFIDGNKTLESYYNEPNVIVQKMKAADNTSILAHCADNGSSKRSVFNVCHAERGT